MEIKLVKWGFRLFAKLSLDIKRVEHVTGVNSNVDQETHFLMWDFDDQDIQVVKLSLMSVQQAFNLPSIIILETGKENCYHAYCFKACTWLEARTILSATPNIDNQYLAIGITRGYFTLRFTDLQARKIKYIDTLESKVESDLSYNDVHSFVNYTKAR